MCNASPHLFSFSKNQDISLRQMINHNDTDLLDHFNLPLSMIAFQQFEELVSLLNQRQMTDDKDRWPLTNNAKFSAKKVYNIMATTIAAPPPFSWIWKSCVQLKHKIFFWLLIQDRLNTRDLLGRKNFYIEDKSCVLCHNDINESRTHLFFGCEFSQIFWWKLNQEWNVDLDLIDMLLDGRNRANQKCFKEFLIIGCWSLWTHRNSIIFNGGHLDLDFCFSSFIETFSLIRHRAKPSLKDGMLQWLGWNGGVRRRPKARVSEFGEQRKEELAGVREKMRESVRG